MKYKDFKGLQISKLGFGAMRLPVTETNGPIDEEKALELVRYAYENGVNYFDTAYFYHQGKSEDFVRKALSKYPRDTWYVADKFPGNFMKVENGKLKIDASFANIEGHLFNNCAEVFELQLKKCGVEYFDFYLLHNVAEESYDLYTDEKLGIIDYLLEQKKLGRIKHLGFSTHAKYETFEKFLNKYDCFEFVQVQLNYLDWTLQDAQAKYKLLESKGIPIVIMEPIRGGKLASPGKTAAEILKKARPEYSPAQWSFRHILSLENVLVTLSGMSTMEQLKENIEIFDKEVPFTQSDLETLEKVAKSMSAFIPCTSCRYCCDTCPKALDIPTLIGAYNEAIYEFSWIVQDVLNGISEDKKPATCISCGACSPLCPQNIDIPDVLHKLAKIIEKNKQATN